MQLHTKVDMLSGSVGGGSIQQQMMMMDDSGSNNDKNDGVSRSLGF